MQDVRELFATTGELNEAASGMSEDERQKILADIATLEKAEPKASLPASHPRQYHANATDGDGGR